MDLGLSLMATPHPSYPPLDLAAAGAVVVTNTFSIKTSLECYSSNIICADPTLEALTEGLRSAVALVCDPMRRQKNRTKDLILRDWRASFKQPLDKLFGS